jgi:acyl-CoA thioester hydrolase
VTLKLLRTPVEPNWIDYNGHLNVAYYHMVFDRGTDVFLDQIGLGEASARKGLGSMFALEDHITYQRELKVDDPLLVTLQVLDHDEKRVHYFMKMFHEEDKYLAATYEHLSLYVDLQSRRSAPMPDSARGKLEALYESQKDLPKPEEAGRVVGIRRRG